MSRYRKPRKQVDLSQLKPDSKEYWEEILRREGLSMSRGLYPTRVSYGWDYHDTDHLNDGDNTPLNKVPHPLAGPPPCELGMDDGPQSKPIGDSYGVAEDSYTEDSKP